MNKIQKISGLMFILFAVQFVIAGTGVDENMLTKMREEKKMTYDLYSEFYQRWSLEVFNSVRESESVHMQRVKELLEKYNIEDPVAKYKSDKGVYTSKEVQKMYDEYTVKGCVSDIVALETAAYMEEKDISDMREVLKNRSDEYMTKVFTQMQKATENHLKAFVKSLKQSGVIYEPKVLAQSDYDLIINPSKEKGTANK